MIRTAMLHQRYPDNPTRDQLEEQAARLEDVLSRAGLRLILPWLVDVNRDRDGFVVYLKCRYDDELVTPDA